MTYGRSRLWLGICGVGSLVVICTLMPGFDIPQRFLSSSQEFGLTDFSQLFVVTILFAFWLAPFDYLGGFHLPRKHHKSFESLRSWLRSYFAASIAHSLLFVSFALSIINAGRILGGAGAVLVVCAGIVLCFVYRSQLMKWREIRVEWTKDKTQDAQALIETWHIHVPQTMIVRHRDVGFTGGIIGIGKSAKIVIPKAWLNAMSKEELATVIARRAVSINSGSYSRGLAIAIMWNLFGFVLSTMLPGGGVTSVAAFVTTVCGFTLWSFLGLLVLPTVSRNASLKVDEVMHQKGIPADLIFNTASALDQMQDGEPDRPKLIETIFHPVPNVSSRNRSGAVRGLVAWNVARTALFLSWPCFGLLSRAVHCNVGRPELWTMLPSD